jgi:Fe2+ or Zn2+ uptake regulation protein
MTEPTPYQPTLEINRRVLDALQSRTRPTTATELVRELKVSYANVYNALTVLVILEQVIDLRPAGYCLARPHKEPTP